MLKNILKEYTKITKKFKKLELLTKVFLILTIFSVYFLFIKKIKKESKFENFTNNFINLNKKNFYEKKYDQDIYDNFYSKLYDHVNLNTQKNKEEIKMLDPYFNDFKYTKILDIGCGTGHHVNLLNKRYGYKIYGIDKSDDMISIAKKNYPRCNFSSGDFLTSNFFDINTFTHILCLNRTLYEIDDLNKFFKQSSSLLNINGYLIINIIDIYNFNPYNDIYNPKIKDIKTPKNSLIHKKNVIFNKDIIYTAQYKNDNNEKLIFNETFKNKKTNTTRQNELIYNIYDEKYIINIAKENNLYLNKKLELKHFKREFLLIFTKK